MLHHEGKAGSLSKHCGLERPLSFNLQLEVEGGKVDRKRKYPRFTCADQTKFLQGCPSDNPGSKSPGTGIVIAVASVLAGPLWAKESHFAGQDWRKLRT